MAIGNPSRSGGIGKRGKSAGGIGKGSAMSGCSLNLDQDRPKTGYPIERTTTTSTSTSTTTTSTTTTTTTTAPG